MLLGDKGYLSKAEALAVRGLKLLTPSRKNIKDIAFKDLTGKRIIIATRFN